MMAPTGVRPRTWPWLKLPAAPGVRETWPKIFVACVNAITVLIPVVTMPSKASPVFEGTRIVV